MCLLLCEPVERALPLALPHTRTAFEGQQTSHFLAVCPPPFTIKSRLHHLPTLRISSDVGTDPINCDSSANHIHVSQQLCSPQIVANNLRRSGGAVEAISSCYKYLNRVQGCVIYCRAYGLARSDIICSTQLHLYILWNCANFRKAYPIAYHTIYLASRSIQVRVSRPFCTTKGLTRLQQRKPNVLLNAAYVATTARLRHGQATPTPWTSLFRQNADSY